MKIVNTAVSFGISKLDEVATSAVTTRTGTTIFKTIGKKVVKFGYPRPEGFRLDGISGFEETDEMIKFFTDKGHVSFCKSSKIKIKEFLLKFMGNFQDKQITIQELDKRIREDFSEDMVKHVHDYMDGKLDTNKLVTYIRKYRKNKSYNPYLEEEIKRLSFLEISPISESGLRQLGLDSFWKKFSLRQIYELAGDGVEQAQLILAEFLKTLGVSTQKRTAIYRYIGKSELDEILAERVVKSRAGYNYGKCFDVTPNYRVNIGRYRVKFNIDANESTCGKSITPNKPEFDYYHWNVPEYDIKSVRSILDQESGEFLYESDEEILSNFLEEYIYRLKI